jgi:hypothetical protein
MIQSVGKIEDELKQLSARYTEKKQQLLSLQKKKGYAGLCCTRIAPQYETDSHHYGMNY